MKTRCLLLLTGLIGCASTPPAARPPAPPGPFAGVIVPMLTPLRGDVVDAAALRALTDWLCGTRADALFAVSGMGQWELLTRDEKAQVVALVVEVAAGRKPVLAGIGGADEAETLDLVAHAARVGADGLVLVTPPWLRAAGGGIPDQDALVAYVERVAAASALPLMLYDPRAEVAWATLTTLGERVPTLRAIKYRTRDALAFQRAVLAAGPRVHVLAGIEHLTLSSLATGGQGVVGGGANLFPDLLADVVAAWRTGDHELALRLQRQVIEANDALEQLGGRAALQRLLREQRGIPIAEEARGASPPPPSLSPTERERLEARLRAWVR